ncbi:neugrin [Apteryx mantelli]|uniref:Neugrin n=1 Tax=Apteryx mantelli TaxID=2696672 RepID=A0ABM4F8Q8_9AVES
MAALLRRGLRGAALLAGASRRAAAARPGDPEPPDAALEEAERARRRRTAARLRRLRRELCPERGAAPGRSLTRQAMEQMRYLRRELPEEWPLQRLAEGFGVSPDEARRVLRSRWSPSPRRGQRQDARALGATGTGTAPGPGPPAGGARGGGAGRDGREVLAPDGSLLYRLPRGQGGPGPGTQ